MTLVAALKIEGIPALIGDFLITDEQRGTEHLWLPTRPNLNDPQYPKIPRRVSGLARKLHLINDRLVVGFTGNDASAGGVIFADLERRFANANTGPSIRAISNALERFNIQFGPPRTTIVIGWTCGSRPRCFRWEAKPGSSATHVTHAVEGSGRDHFIRMLTDAQPRGYSPAVKTAFDKSVLLGLAKVGALLTEELSTATNLQASYGYGAEIALYTGNRFEFPKLGYFFWNARIEQNGSVTITLSNVHAVYEARGRYSILAVDHFSLGDNGVLKAENTYATVLKPLHDNMPGLVLTRADAPTPECPYYFNGILFTDTRTNLKGRVHAIFAADNGPFRLRKRDGLYFVECELLRDMILSAASTPIPAAERSAETGAPRGR
jgi:hypothetical protein